MGTRRAVASPAETHVVVLNATETNGLAHQLSANLQQSGYTQSAALDGHPTGRSTSVVEYESGHHTEAEHVAQTLGIAQVSPLEGTVMPLAPGATVVVIAGADQAAAGSEGRGHRSDRRERRAAKRPTARLSEGPLTGAETPTVSFLDIPERTRKPRERGLTHVLDRGLALAEVDGLIEVAGDCVDIVKLGWGTALVSANLRPKLERYAEHGIPVVLGGTLTELAIKQGRVEGLVAWLRELGLRHVEVSDGTIALEPEVKSAPDPPVGRERVHRARGGRQQGHGLHHGAVRVGRADRTRPGGGRVEGDRGGARVGDGGHLPRRRRGADAV